MRIEQVKSEEARELETWLSKMKQTESAADQTDSCGRSHRTRNVFALNAKDKDAFIRFLQRLRANGILKDGAERVSAKWSITNGEWRTPICLRDYDGFVECDAGGGVVQCKSYAYATFQLTRWGKFTSWGREREDFINTSLEGFGMTSHYNSYSSSPHSDENVICFIG